MGLIMDVVPNHMAVMGMDNGWWLDVLENGPASRFASYFDIDWYALSGDLPGRVLLPILGDHYGAVLENGELKLRFDAEEGSFSIFYYEHRFPVDPREYPRILNNGINRLVDPAGDRASGATGTPVPGYRIQPSSGTGSRIHGSGRGTCAR